ncbi:hypothetical protein EMPG_17026, partial [Blastomyces silverae]
NAWRDEVFHLCQLPSTANLAVHKLVIAQHRPASSIRPLLELLPATELSIRINIGRLQFRNSRQTRRFKLSTFWPRVSR